MKKRVFKTPCFALLGVLGIIMSLFIQQVAAEESTIPVTIKGKIANIADVGQYISHETRLQLYPCETSGRIELQRSGKGIPEATPAQKRKVYYMDGRGRLVPQSSLPGIMMPVFGDFNFFRARGLVPGECYKIGVLMLDPPYPGMVLLLDAAGKPFEIKLPAPEEDDQSGKITVDISKQSLRIPEL